MNSESVRRCDNYLPIIACLIIMLTIFSFACPVFSNDIFYTIFISQHATETSAIEAVSDLETKGFDAFYRYSISLRKNEKFKVYVGNFPSQPQADEMFNKLLDANLSQHLAIIRLNNFEQIELPEPNPILSSDPVPPPQNRDPSDSDTSSDLSSDNALSDALMLYHEEKYAKALSVFNTMLEKEDNPDIMFWAGKCALKTGQYEMAIMHYNNFLRVETNAPQVLLDLAAIYLKQKKYKEALSTLEKAKELSPPPDALKKINKDIKYINSNFRNYNWKFSASQGGGIDDNINCGIAENHFINIPADLLDKKKSSLWLSYMNAELDYDIGEIKHFFWKSTLALYNNHCFKDHHYNYGYIDITTGPYWKNLKNRIDLPLEFMYKRLGNTSLSNIFAIAPQIEYFPSNNNKISINSSYRISGDFFSDTVYDEQGYNNISQHLSMGPNYYLSSIPGMILFRSSFEYHNAENESLSFSALHFITSFNTELSTGASIYWTYDFSKRKYAEAFSLIGLPRKDDRHTITFGLSQTFFNHYFVATDFLYVNNQSNNDLFEFIKKRWCVTGGVKF